MNHPLVKTVAEIETQVRAIDPVAYAKTRNQHDGAVTKLSPYITRGVISLPRVKEILLEYNSKKDCSKLLQELAWREYFQNVWWSKQDEIFSDLRFSRDDWRHEELVTSIVKGETGIAELDRRIHELYETGYMHNHVRMSVASVACNLAKAHWHEMGRWLYYHLIDGDPASNFCSWQWVAGTSVNKQYFTSQAVINACSDSTERGTWLDFDREEMPEQELPTVLEERHVFEYSTEYPASDELQLASGDTVALYTPWTLNPNFGTDSSTKILVIDTNWFNTLPVSPLVMDFILEQGKTVIDDLQVYAGTTDELFKKLYGNEIAYQAHQTTINWLGEGSAPEKLIPAVEGYFPSFYKYWQKAQHKL